MEAHEIAERIEEHAEPHAHAPPTHDWFRRVAAIYVGVAAMLLAIAALGGAEATKEMLNSNIQSSDTYAFYQAKNIRQTLYQTSAAQLELLAAGAAALSDSDKAKAAELIKRYRDTVTRYESEPETKEGKKELMAKAKEWEHKRDHASAQIPNFEYGEALLQIAIVLASSYLITGVVYLLWGALGLGGLGLFFVAIGFVAPTFHIF